MGDLIYLDARRKPQFEPPQDVRPTFFFDLACPFSYLVAERVERMLGDAEWVPVSAGGQLQGAGAAASRGRAALRARQLRLPLVWPERFPAAVPSGRRAAAHGAELGAGADPEPLAAAASPARGSLDGCLQASGGRSEDEALLIAADELRSRGMNT